jgi:hypothetical protein
VEAAIGLGFLVPQDGPEFFRELTRVGTQLLTNRDDVNDLVGEQYFQQWFDQRPVAGDQREAGECSCARFSSTVVAWRQAAAIDRSQQPRDSHRVF